MLETEHRELGEKVWCALLAENNSYPAGKEAAIAWRCRDAGYEDA